MVVALAVAVGGWAAWSGGRSSVAFLVGATLAMGWVVWLVFRAAHALVKDAPVVEAGAVVTGKRRKELEREKQSLLKALKELDFDHQMGKVSDKDFADISATYRARAIRVMRQLDEAGRDYEAMIAKDVAARAGKPVNDVDGSRRRDDQMCEVRHAERQRRGILQKVRRTSW